MPPSSLVKRSTQQLDLARELFDRKGMMLFIDEMKGLSVSQMPIF